MEGDCIRRSAPGHQQISVHVDLRELAGQLERETLETAIGDEQVRAEAQDRHQQSSLACVAECFPELVDRLRSCKGRSGSSRAECGEA